MKTLAAIIRAHCLMSALGCAYIIYSVLRGSREEDAFIGVLRVLNPLYWGWQFSSWFAEAREELGHVGEKS